MDVEQAVLEKFRALPPEKKHEVLHFVEFLATKKVPERPNRRLKGILADLDLHISDEDISEARHEMWGNFPREEPR